MRMWILMAGILMWAAAARAEVEVLPFSVVDSRVGFQEAAEFQEFLSAAREGGSVAKVNPLAAVANPWVAFLMILVGGLLLNLTPCVLPMIPVNLMIIGAGAMDAPQDKPPRLTTPPSGHPSTEGNFQPPRPLGTPLREGNASPYPLAPSPSASPPQEGTRFSWRGLRLGGLYGVGIAVAYGALGTVSALTGTAFGWVQSIPWFSAVMALFFAVLALAMLDVFPLSLERFGQFGRRGAMRWWTVMLIGAGSAVLAGHCVAPVLVWTLLWSADLYAQGHVWGVFLPFVLGIGMALPWPVAGAGFSVAPKPGRWMVWVKRLIAVVMAGMALYYVHVTYMAYAHASVAKRPYAETGCGEWRCELNHALVRSLETGKPVFVDLWATWCAACRQMEQSTLKHEEIRRTLEDFIVVKIECASFKDEDTAALMKAMGARGLPTYVVIRPEK